MSEQSALERETERRRVVDRALEQRPDLEVEDLLRILDRLGIGVDEATLVADLDALGFDVVDTADAPAGPGGDAFADPLEARRGRGAQATPSEAEAEAEVDGDDADRSDADADGGEAPAPRRARADLPLIAGAGLVLLALIVAVLALGGGGGDDAATGAVPEGSIPVEPSTTEAPATPSTVAVPAGPAPDPALTEPDVALTFDTDSGVLPPVGEASWTAVSGDFEVRDGVARSLVPAEGGSVATFPTTGSDVRAQVTLPEASDGAGLVFGADEGGYYAWIAAEGASRADLVRVTPAGRAVVVSSEPVAFVPGLTLGVNLVGTRAEVLANGVVVATTEMDAPSAALGLAALTDDVAGVYDDLYVQYP